MGGATDLSQKRCTAESVIEQRLRKRADVKSCVGFLEDLGREMERKRLALARLHRPCRWA